MESIKVRSAAKNPLNTKRIMLKVSTRAATYKDIDDLHGRFGLVLNNPFEIRLLHIAATNHCTSCGRDKIVGYVHSIVHKETNDETNECKHHAKIHHVVVLRSYHRHGIGTKLVTVAIEDLERMYHPECISALVPRKKIGAYCLFAKTLGYDINHGADLENNGYIFRKQMHFEKTKGNGGASCSRENKGNAITT